MIYLGNGLYSDSGPDTLAHYGRLGMKWGQHIFGKEVDGTNGYARKRKTKWGTQYQLYDKADRGTVIDIIKDDAKGSRNGYINWPNNLIYHFDEYGRFTTKKPILSAGIAPGIDPQYVYHGGNIKVKDINEYLKKCFKKPPKIEDIYGLPANKAYSIPKEQKKKR